MPGTEDQDEVFAEIALERGWLTPDHVREARQAQLRLSEVGLSRRLWQVCEERGYLSSDRIRIVQQAMVRERGVRARVAGYEIIERIGRGGMGQVFRARQLSVNRIVALKVLSAGLARDPDFVRRFSREAQLAGKLDHPNIVRVLNFGEDSRRYFMAMEFVEGRSVAQFIQQEGRLPLERAIEIGIQVARGLQHAHDRGIVHRDVKPSNILIHIDGLAKVSDLGIAREAGKDGSGTPLLIGTPAYVAPEQVQTHTADARSDIYSFGATLFHMLTGRPPFEGATAYEVVSQHISSPPPSLRELRPEIPEGVEAIVHRMMAKRPLERYASCEEVARELEATQRGQKPRTLTEPRRGRARRERRRRGALLVAATGSLLLGFGLLGLLSGRAALPGRGGGETLLIGRIWGQDTGLPLVGVRVDEGPTGPVTRTDSRGYFRLRARGHGRHLLSFSRKGYHSAKLVVESSGPTLWTDSYALTSTRPRSAIRRAVVSLGLGRKARDAPGVEGGLGLRLVAHSRETGRVDLEAKGGLVFGGKGPLSVFREAAPKGYRPRLGDLIEGDVFFLRTSGGLYAKLRVMRSLAVARPVFEVVLQEDGSRRFPKGPWGLRARWVDGVVRITWDETPRAQRYTVWRRAPWRAFEKLRSTAEPFFLDPSAAKGGLYVYAVNASGEELGETDASETVAYAGPAGLLLHDVELRGRAIHLDVFEGRRNDERFQITFFREGARRVYVSAPPRGGMLLKWTRFGNLRRAPLKGYRRGEVQARPGETLCLRTPDGRYAKLRLSHVGPGTLTVECVAQPDGSRRFPAGPAGLKASAAGGAVQLKWQGVEGAEGYRVWRRERGGTWRVVGETKATGWREGKPPPAGDYEYGVTALVGADRAQSDRSTVKVRAPASKGARSPATSRCHGARA